MLGAYYLQQSVCVLPATPATTRVATKVVRRLRAEGGQGEMLRIQLEDARQEAKVIDAMQAERTDEYHELIESTRQFHEELECERIRGRAMYTELEESDADLARYKNWLAAVRARDYFDAPGRAEATAAVSRRVRRRSPDSRARRYPPSSTSLRPTHCLACAQSTSPASKAPRADSVGPSRCAALRPSQASSLQPGIPVSHRCHFGARAIAVEAERAAP